MKNVNRTLHGEGNTFSPNMHKVTVYLYNPVRKDSTTGKGSRDFKTTHSFREIDSFEKAIATINQFAENRRDGSMNYSLIKKAYYNGKLLVSDGKWIAKNSK